MVDLIQLRSLTTAKMALCVSGLLAVVLVTGSESRQGLGAVAGQYLFWFLHALAGLVLLLLITPVVRRLRFNRLSHWQLHLLGAAIGTVAFTPIALILELLFSGTGLIESDTSTLTEVLNLRMLVDEWSHLAGPFTASWLLVNLSYSHWLEAESVRLGADLERRREDVGQIPDAGFEGRSVDDAVSERFLDKADPKESGLFELLPAALDRDVRWMRSDLNYLRVYTRTGQAMVLYSLRSAASDLSDKGLLIHRSYWVAQQAVASVRRSSNGMFIVLHGGRELPVSRRRQKAVLEQFGANYRSQRPD